MGTTLRRTGPAQIDTPVSGSSRRSAQPGGERNRVGLLARLFRRGGEEDQGPPEPVGVEEQPEPDPEPEPASAREPEPAPDTEREPELEAASEPEPPPPAEPGASQRLALSLEEAIAVLREAGSDTIRVGFVARAYSRADEEERGKARRQLVTLLEEQLRTRGALAPDGSFELVETSVSNSR